MDANCRLVLTGKAAGRCPAGLALWGEIRRWRSWGGRWVVERVQTPGTVPLFLPGADLWGGGVWDRSYTPSRRVPQKHPGWDRSAQPASCLGNT